MKTLSLTQPWATLVVIGVKRIETRSWGTAYHGPLAIHASKGFPKWAKETCTEEPFRSALNGNDLPLGCIVGTCELIAVVPTVKLVRLRKIVGFELTETEEQFGDYGDGRFAWLLSHPVPLATPVPAKGSLGLWECDL